ncbi:unnamed protein product [Phytophthora fragariaefolia]|uniref:Unnamed protein product n=1 Tax=Phytophthora fragariaefolia TaxID=1490495 RepID=A0A9W6UE93_9STRA|nr:unnamed protein product [Phytophthora fragariaefolia]
MASFLKYLFPGSSADFRDVVCAIQSITMYNSEYNIDSFQFHNTIFKIEVPRGATTSNISVSLQDGIYSYEDINRSIQTALVYAGAYLIDSTAIIYSTVELVATVFITLRERFRSDRWYVSISFCYRSQRPAIEHHSTDPPPTSSYIARCDFIKNEYGVSGDIVSAFDSGDAEIGKLILYKPSQYVRMNCHHGSRSTITVSIYDQKDKTVTFRDTSDSIVSLLRPKI